MELIKPFEDDEDIFKVCKITDHLKYYCRGFLLICRVFKTELQNQLFVRTLWFKHGSCHDLRKRKRVGRKEPKNILLIVFLF